jgi:GAF domain-containing protein
MMGSLSLTTLINFANSLLSIGIAVTAFALLLYIIRYNWRSPVARAFCIMLAGVMIVSTGDAVMYRVTDPFWIERWLRLQWLGIALVPAAYLHFSDEVLRTTNSFSRARQALVIAAYGASFCFMGLALFGDAVVSDGELIGLAPRLQAGPLFGWYALYTLATMIAGLINILHARNRCLTPTSRRRMTYLLYSSTGPAFAVFPYLLLSSNLDPAIPFVLWVVLLAGNILIFTMLIVMGYSVAYFGVLAPDRVVKYRLIRFLFRGPLLAITVAAAVAVLIRIEQFLGLPSETITILAVVFFIVLFQIVRGSLQPFLELLLFQQDRSELDYIRSLSDRLLTSTDLQQFLENVLTAVADLLRVPRVFLASLDNDGRWRARTQVGPIETYGTALAEMRLTHIPIGEPGPIVVDGFWVWPLWARSRNDLLGALAVAARSSEPDLSEVETKRLQTLITQASIALEDRRLQKEVFAAVERIMPEIDVLQRQRGEVRYTDSPTQPSPEATVTDDPEFPNWVKDALSHYWGGPKLTASPLLKMQVVEQALDENNDDAPKALKAVLAEAIEQLRPDGERSFTAAEWVLYNILEMRFIQGRRVRDIATRLAMSESDLYRKQKIAVEAVAASLSKMEERAATDGTNGHLPNGAASETGK